MLWLVGEDEGSGPIAVPLIFFLFSSPPRRQLFLPFFSLSYEITCIGERNRLRERTKLFSLLNCDVTQSIDCNSTASTISTCCNNKTIKQRHIEEKVSTNCLTSFILSNDSLFANQPGPYTIAQFSQLPQQQT